jgi:cellulose synthase/poly-beta-1,6-N-acetylglucosamine synthase-like glycosyltransferase
LKSFFEGTFMTGLTHIETAALALLLLYYVVLTAHFTRGFGRLRRPANPVREPFVSVVVAARNEVRNLPRLFESLGRQDYPARRTRIILVDDRSTDGSLRLMRDFAGRHKNAAVIPIRRRSPGSPKKAALTRGITAAPEGIILTTDADASPGPSWIRETVRWYDADTAAVLGYAPYRTDPPYDGFFHRLLALEYFSMGAVAAATAGMGTPSTCNGANFSFRRDVFTRLKGYGGTAKWLSGDDDLFMQRIAAETGMKIRFAASRRSAVFNNPPESLSAFVRQRIRFSSKHLAYPKRMIAVLTGVYLFYAVILAETCAVPFNPRLGLPVLAAWTLKSLFEIRFLRAAAKRLEDRRLLRYYCPLLPFHIVYVVLFPLLGRVIKPRWK